MLNIIKQQRGDGAIAPVDSMGCEKISGDAAATPEGLRFVTLVSAMLSSQTKDPAGRLQHSEQRCVPTSRVCASYARLFEHPPCR